jgi:hypothetical protein
MPSLTDIEGIGPSLAAACVKSNFRTIAKIAAAKTSELSTVPGISEKGASQIIVSAKSLLSKSQISTTKTKNKRRAVGPAKIGGKAVASQLSRKSLDREKVMSAKEVKAKIKKLRKKIKNLKADKKKILAKESKKSKKEKSKKSSKKK